MRYSNGITNIGIKNLVGLELENLNLEGCSLVTDRVCQFLQKTSLKILTTAAGVRMNFDNLNEERKDSVYSALTSQIQSATERKSQVFTPNFNSFPSPISSQSSSQSSASESQFSDSSWDSSPRLNTQSTPPSPRLSPLSIQVSSTITSPISTTSYSVAPNSIISTSSSTTTSLSNNLNGNQKI